MSGSGVKNRLPPKFCAAAGNRPQTPKRPPPVSIRFNADERAALVKMAKGEALGPYIKRCVLKRKSRPSGKQHKAIAKTLRGLGQSGVSGALQSLLLAVEEGRLPIERDDEKALRQATSDVLAMRGDLMAALGLHADGGPL
ncbi:MAG: hypothetical protein AAGG72_09455 [Pseudomonadota bacterium]